MTERERLARIFGIEPVRPFGALVMAGVLGVIPMAWIGSGLIVVALAAIYADEQRKIADGLREVARWGFVVDGYREWLLANEPAFDLELCRDVSVELLAASVSAVDRAIVVERRVERVVRVIMRRVEVRGGEAAPTFLAGDRARLSELRDRVLAPLHADVGIAAMRMGERAALGALVAAPAPVAGAGAAFREQGLVAPPDLQSLAQVGTSQLRPPREARSLQFRTDRLLFATGQSPTDAKAMAAAIGGGTIVGLIVAPPLALVGAGIGSGLAFILRRNDLARLRRALEHSRLWPFPVDGYEDWLLSGRPICDIEFASPPPRDETQRGLRGVARAADLTWLADTLVRVESQPIFHSAAQGIPSFWGGDLRELQLIVRRVLIPLHEAHRIVAVRMGGYLDRRV